MSDYDALRKVINHEANQDDDGGLFAKLGGIEPDPEDDAPTARGLFQHVDFTKPGTPVYAAKPGEIRATGWNVRPGRTWNPALGQYPFWYKINGGEIRTCKVWKKQDYDIFEKLATISVRLNEWRWRCRLCGLQGALPTWKLAHETATHHAHNHHRSTR